MEVSMLKDKEVVLLKTKDCEWCDDLLAILQKLDRHYVSVKLCDNNLAKAVAKKVCGGSYSCLLIDGKPLRQLDLDILCDELLD
jgi:hypothetical protein